MCRIPAAMLADDREAALGLFQRAGALAARRPTLMTDPFHGMWLLVRLVAGTAGRDDLAVLDRLAPGSLWHAMHDGFARAIVAGRQGEADRAGTAFADGRRAAARYPMHEALYVRLVAEAALADGWGEPVAWLRDAEAWFVAHGHARSSAACRGLLKRAGAIVGRSGEQAESEVPADLRERGVTAREAEVLDLLGRRLTNREIAARLYLSPRTVEKHVASLLAKLGASSRRDLTHPPER
jgi:DNA-binding CsgD family transcriptional regulator